jgi:N utilization substance protein B
MKRSAAREIAVRICFSIAENPTDPGEFLSRIFEDEYYNSLKNEDELYSKKPGKKQQEYITRLVTGVFAHSAELDSYIDTYSVGWRFGRISRTAIAIMKVAMYEILYLQDVPDNVAINEAVEIAKKYENPETVSFLNGVLGSFIKTEKQI